MERGFLHLVGLGAGGGQKDSRLLELLTEKGCEVIYTPVDVGSAIVLEAREASLEVISPDRCYPIVCDLATEPDLPSALDRIRARPMRYSKGALSRRPPRLFTFFGMIPNFVPSLILPRLAELIRPGDWLLFSANLAPGSNYEAGVKKVLPQYDNGLTRDWLLTFLFDLGVEAGEGDFQFLVEDDLSGCGLKRIAARFTFLCSRTIQVGDTSFCFKQGDHLRLFFSYRFTPAQIRRLLLDHGLRVHQQWITKTGEEGVFLVSGLRL
jgi:uncharacterized SAM-dependent methyltransferase